MVRLGYGISLTACLSVTVMIQGIYVLGKLKGFVHVLKQEAFSDCDLSHSCSLMEGFAM